MVSPIGTETETYLKWHHQNFDIFWQIGVFWWILMNFDEEEDGVLNWDENLFKAMPPQFWRITATHATPHK